ncbi:DNA repair protein RecN [Nocardioides marmoriginsengisoli]|uniref:DNA repair protein RecN n=1 Tax=Nocardioides marmoriginsengisoli TaxID=661483 RepID=A0A3N0CJS7_9ACTN|nr:DNA repair protein RecN [Nocardioides marmoriginsengisoli]RNL63695.1 DNA repair protein RecN [Nocardioides marmoriginsengisoli]
MIEEIRIASLGVIDESVLELGPGLNVVTGETGAGKTMLVTALGLLLGARADAGAVRNGAKAARVEGIVAVTGGPIPAMADELGGEVEDGTLVLARQVSAEGRSRAFLGGASVPISALQSVADHLVAVHGQSDQHRLLQAEAQRAAVDGFAGAPLAEVAAEYRTGYAALRKVEGELAEVVGAARERAREADVLRLGLDEIEAVEPLSGEDVALAHEESRLGFADTLRTAAEEAREALSSDTVADSGTADALGAMATARRALESVREHDVDAGKLADRVAEVSYLLADVAADVASYASALDTDPARLAVVSERRAALTALTRKYGETVDEVLAWAAASAERLLVLENSENRAEELRAERARLRAELADRAAALSVARTAAGAALSAAVSDELSALAMPHARVEIVVGRTPDPEGLEVDGGSWRFTGSGIDQVEILLAANTGSEPRPLNKGASGGELSRVMLAIEVVLAGTSPVPTFVFDEVDAGVGGKAAVEIGRRLAALAGSAQVLVVTHLPQVAAFADRHVVVAKASDGRVTTSGLSVLDDAGRVRELSRMLAGLEESETAMAHAQELLDVAQQARTARS